MFIPLGTDRPLSRPTLINYVLISLSVAVFIALRLAQSRSAGAQEAMLSFLWLDPKALTLWGLLTYQFTHAGAMHLFGNMLFLWVFGPNVEDRLGRWWYLLFFLVGGVAAGLTHMTFSKSPVIGASGSIAAVTGAYFVLFPRTHVRTLLFFFLIGIFNIPAMWFIGFAVAKDVFFSGVGGGEVAHTAHLGGYAFGASVAFTLLATGLIPREMYDLFSIGKQARRRRALREITSKGYDPWSGGAPGGRIRASVKEDPKARERAEHRSAALAALARDDVEGALAEARELLHMGADAHFPRDANLRLANTAFETGDYALARALYEGFLAKHKHDSEAARVSLMLALTLARYLGDPLASSKRIKQALKGPLSEEEKALAVALQEETRSASA